MQYINTDSEKYDIKHGRLTENPLRGSIARYICNPIVDDIEAPPDPKGRARRRRINGRIIFDTTVPHGGEEQYRPPSCLVTSGPSINDLASWRWQGRTVGRDTERELIRRIQEGDPRCRAGSSRSCSCRSCLAFFDPRPNTISLLPAFHHSIRKIAGGYVPKRGQGREHKKETASLIFQELMAVGCFGLFKAALAFDFDRGYRLWTIAQPKIDGLISNEANYLRWRGYTSGDTAGRYLWKRVGRRTQTRIDRWIIDHLGSPPEELLEAQAKLGLKRPVFHSLEEAAAAIKAASGLEHCDVYSDDGEDGSGNVGETAATEPAENFRDLYDSGNPLKLSPQLQTHREVSAIVDFWINKLCYPLRIKAKPQPKPVYKPCAVKPTGRVIHPIDKPYWMEPRDERPKERAGKPYDPDRREVAVIRLKSGKTKRVYRQMTANPGRHIQVNEAKGKQNDVRPNRNQAIGSPTAEIVVFQSRASGVEGLHLGERCYSPCIGQRFTGARIAGQ